MTGKHQKHPLFLALALTLIVCVKAPALLAADIVSVYGTGCELATGAIVEVDDERVAILTLDGRVSIHKLSQIQTVARYHVLENPFRQIAGTQAIPIMEIESESEEEKFMGFATNFYENLVLFLDVAGKIRVIENQQIVAIRHVRRDKTYTPSQTRTPRLFPPVGKETCQPASPENQATTPQAPGLLATHVINDTIRLDSFWETFRRGYRQLEGLRERTIFYSRPIVVDQKSRLGIVFQERSIKNHLKIGLGPEEFPLYFSFGGGDAYRFQSSMEMGGKSFNSIPVIRPIFGLRSQFKSHLIHGELVANLSAFSAGAPVFTYYWTPVDAPQYRFNAPWVLTTLNHLTLLGADIGPWSASYGYYFPVFGIGKGKEFREVTPDSTSSVLRGRYRTSTYTIESLLFLTKDKGDVETPEFDFPNQLESRLGMTRYYSDFFQPNSAKVSYQALRTNFLYEPHQDFLAGFSILYSQLEFRESATFISEGNGNSDVGVPVPVRPVVENAIDQKLLSVKAQVRIDLGKWVALAAEASFEHSEIEGVLRERLNESSGERVDDFTTYVAVLELLL